MPGLILCPSPALVQQVISRSYPNLVGENYWSSSLYILTHSVSLENLEVSSGLVEYHQHNNGN